MQKILSVILLAALLLTLTACTGGPLVATATPEPTPTPSPTPTPVPTPTPYIQMFQMEIWPETSMTKLLPVFPYMLENAMQTDDEYFYATYQLTRETEFTDYVADLKEAGFTDIEQDEADPELGFIFIASKEGTDGKFSVSLWWDGGYGNIQIKDDRAK